MTSALRLILLLISLLLMLSACAANTSSALAPTSTPTARQQAAKDAPSDRVELAAGQYQLLMFYSPL
jgi:ABC-type Fe3+-hydroxamate transport system substrate-binding protein